jgi:hypothetical protein
MAVMRHRALGEQPAHQGEALIQHVAPPPRYLQTRSPGQELLAIGADADGEDQPSS